MLFMESYMCYCSVRLGVIVVAILTILRCLSLSIVLFVLGVACFDPLIDILEHDADYKDRKMVRRLINWIENSPENFLISLQIIFYAHIAAAILSIWGSLKLQKWLVLPLAFFELAYFLQFTIQHIFLMIMLKKQINLGLLIILTLIGSFYILFVGYNAFTCVAMFQVISLVRSPQYRELYGDDPFHPLATRSHPHRDSSVQQLRVLKMDNDSDTDIDEQKRLSKLGLWPRRYPQVVSVIPVQAPYPPLKWWQLQAMDTGQDKLQLDSSAVYRNWQQGELLNGVGGEVQRKNALNRRYAESQMHRWY